MDSWGKYGQENKFGGAIMDTSSFEVRDLKLSGYMYHTNNIVPTPSKCVKFHFEISIFFGAIMDRA